ncbi:MAG: dihydrodipicolinate synthase family protein [Planctomycetota bacterium]|nr:dihydrodipicolinate synthase family protein [Planctomycetota bacterium]
MRIADLPADLVQRVRAGLVIPANPLALTAERKLDERRQRALTRYYVDAGSGGLAVGVHSTQFEIREPQHALFEPVLKLASETADDWCARRGVSLLKVAGVCGKTRQAVKEAEFAVSAGYHAGLLSLAALKSESIDEVVAHCREVAKAIPLIGFYLQPAVGGRELPYAFWRRFAELENVLAIKMAPFNRYKTFDVIRGVCEAGREKDIALYTGNDDNILVDLLTEFRVRTSAGERRARIAGGLLGHWCVWTRKAVEQLARCHEVVRSGRPVPQELLTLAAEVTDANAAFFDPAHAFSGCLPGIHEVLRRQGLLAGIWCLNPKEVLSPGQREEIDRVYAAYPHLNDDAFVRENLETWLKG